jgi:hypothetical protein
MQGPILTRGSLTLKSLSAYRNLYPNTPMVLSTWRKEVDEIHDELKNLDIDIIETERPAYPGYGNINLQITSAINGINHSLKYNPKFLLKTRTDIFLSSPNFLETLIEHSWFGSKDNALVNRLIITSFNSFIFRPFSFNDQLTFGKTSDVVRFWSAPNDYRLESEMLGAYSKNLIEQSRARCAEVWLVTNYLQAMSYEFEFSIESSLIALRDYFYVIEDSLLGVIWYKSLLREIDSLWDPRVHAPEMRNIKMVDWLRLNRDFDKFLVEINDCSKSFMSIE